MADDIKTFVDTKIGSKRVVVFSKMYCPFCTKAKKALSKHDLTEEEYEVVEIEDDPNCQAIQDYLYTLTHGRSVPRVFIDGKFIGGGDETDALHRSGKLKELLGK